MATMSKVTLSPQADGDGIRIGTASPIDGSDTLLHTASASATGLDLVTLFAYNKHTAPVALHLKWGDSTDAIIVTIANQTGLALIAADMPITDGNTVEASAATVDVITVYGYVNRITY